MHFKSAVRCFPIVMQIGHDSDAAAERTSVRNEFGRGRKKKRIKGNTRRCANYLHPPPRTRVDVHGSVAFATGARAPQPISGPFFPPRDGKRGESKTERRRDRNSWSAVTLADCVIRRTKEDAYIIMILLEGEASDDARETRGRSCLRWKRRRSIKEDASASLLHANRSSHLRYGNTWRVIWVTGWLEAGSCARMRVALYVQLVCWTVHVL